jgi:3-dehydroquinate dehydratase type I
MKRSLNDEIKCRVCVPIVETTMDKALKTIEEIKRFADLIELRIDYLKEPNLNILLERREKPFIVTNRRQEEGGRYEGDEQKRLYLLKEAMDIGVEYIDLEMRSKRLESFIRRDNTKLILSWHDFRKTPSLKELRNILEEMMKRGADVAKIVPLARSLEDNFKILSLIPYGKERKLETIAFCMGDTGKMSRIFAPLFGAPWTYASMDKRHTSSPGQITLGEIRKFWKRLK